MADKKSLVNIDFGGSSSIKNLPSATAASGDYIVLTDASDGGKAKKGPSFGANDGTFLRKDGTWAGLGGTTISANATPIVTFKKSATSSGSFVGFKPNNQDNSVWLAGVTSALAFRFSYSTNGGTTVTKKVEIDTDGNLDVAGYIKEGGTKLSELYNTKKYRHRCTFEWNTGSGSSYYCGSLSFWFDDNHAESYSDEDFGAADILNFIKTHCNMPDDKLSFLEVSGGGVVGVEIATPYRTNETWIVTCLKNDYGDWYCNAVHYSKTNNFGNFKLEYYQGSYITFIPSGGVSVLYDRVTPL